jgi:hypothetical protein
MHESVDGMDVSLYLLSEGLPNPRANVESLGLALKAMEDRWGPYPYPSYAIAEIPNHEGHFGASSEQGFIMVKPFFLQVPGGNLPLFAHEAAHGWWGNTVGTKGPGSLLCSESLAQYGAVIAAERVWSPAHATEFLRFSRPGYVPDQCARGYFEIWRQGKDKPLAELVSGGGSDHTLSDAKGHWVFHMLRRRVGDETFFAVMRGLIAEFDGRTMTLDDVRARFVAAAPDARLPQFFAQWLDRTGAPVLRSEWHMTGDGVALTITQMQDGAPYDLDLDVRIARGDAPPRTERVRVHEREHTFQLAAAERVTGIALDPDHALLVWKPEYGPAPVPGLEGLEPPPLPESQTALYSGTFTVRDAPVTVEVTEASGHVMLAIRGDTQRLVHTGDHRFRAADGFVIFRVADGRAGSLLYVRDGGGTRVAVREE